MAPVPVLGVFRSRAVVVAGTVDVVIGLVALGIGADLAGGHADRSALPFGLLLVLIGGFLAIGGVGRVSARLELCSDRVRWRWYFAWHEILLGDLDDAALVEKGSPASGASWAGFLGGGFISVLIWWFGERVYAVLSSEPSLGRVELVLTKRHSAPVEVRPISAWSTRSSHSKANQALAAIKAAIVACDSTASTEQPAQSWQLLHDEWESPTAQPEAPPTSVQRSIE